MTGQKYSFIAYIDESGDDGFSEASSNWFVLSAMVVRASRDNELVGLKKEISSQIKNEKKCIHMKDIRNFEKKCFVAKRMAEFPARYISVLSNKENINKSSFTNRPNMYYWYLSRLLIERITWCCSDLRKNVPEGNGKIKIIFSNRGGMKYADFKEYLEKQKEKDLATKAEFVKGINWNMIDIDVIESLNQSDRSGLQFADIVAYSTFKAVEKHRDFGTVSLDLIRELKRNFYNTKEHFIDKGIKLMPKYEEMRNKPTDLYELFYTKI